MAYTTMKTWGSETLTSADMKTYLTDNIEYLKGVSDGLVFKGVSLTRVAATSISTSTNTDVSWSAEIEDIGGWWTSGVNITVPSAAIPTGFTTIKLLVVARTLWATNATGTRKMILRLNGGAFASPNVAALPSDDVDQDVTEFVSAVAGDIVTLQLWQDSGGGLDASNTKITVVRFAPVS